MRTITNSVLLIAVLLYPVQTISVELATSRYDLSAFLLWGLGALFFFKGARVSRRGAAVLSGFVFLQLVTVFFYGVPPFDRFLSGLIWFGGIVMIFGAGERIRFPRHLVVWGVWATTALSAVYILLDHFQHNVSRPKAWFAEPSPAGLALYSACAGILAMLTLGKVKRTQKASLIGLACLFLVGALSTYSMHVVTFTIISLIVLGYHYVRARTLFSPRKVITAFVLSALLITGLTSLWKTEHFQSRIDVSEAADNVSLMSWLRGFDQMRAAAVKSPVLGYGLGGTGEFDFQSPWNSMLADIGLAQLNLKDAYSLAFRLIIELGPVVFIVCAGWLMVRLYQSLARLPQVRYRNPYRLFLIVFSTAMILGALIKEPLYSQSYLYVAAFILSREVAAGSVVDKSSLPRDLQWRAIEGDVRDRFYRSDLSRQPGRIATDSR